MSYPAFSFGRICGPKFQNPCLYVTGSLQIGTHLNIQLFATQSMRGFQTCHSELSVVWAKRRLVANNIESKKLFFSSNLTLGPSLTKICVWIHKNKRFVETVLSSTHETLQIKKYTIYIRNPMCYIFDICECFDVPGFELSFCNF